MLHRLLLAGFMAMTLAACESPSHLHVHSGPMAETNPGLVIPYRSSGQGNIGSVSFAYPNATCNGKWERITKRVSADLLRDSGDVTWHGGVTGMGEGNTVLHTGDNAQILGAGECSDGTSFVFFTIANGYKGRGALKDSRGNMFTMLLR
jgi:hypothetical protein